MARKAEKKEARDIIESITARKLNFSGITQKEFVQGVRSNWGCSTATANLVAKMTGNW